MGKKDGFLVYDRRLDATVPPRERIDSFDEFHKRMPLSERREQAARCMDCGVPFCQSGMKLNGMYTGCPLNNLIPEWNDMLYRGNLRHALDRLVKVNCFPEFTGRVCPALCEAACTCGLNGEPVTIRENELALIEEAFDNKWMQANPPQVGTGTRIAVVGSGPAGLAAAYTLNRRGHSVVVYEKEDRPGGLLMYGIPNMKLDKSVVMRRIELMKAEGVEFVFGADVGKNVRAEEIIGSYDAVIMACGAGQPRDLDIPGRDAQGVYFAVDYLKSATRHLLDGTEPISAAGKRVVIVGGGDTGNDCVGTCIRQGATSVIQIEMMPKLPVCRSEDNPWPEWPRILKTDYGQQEAVEVFGTDPRMFETTVTEIIKGDAGSIKGVKLVKLKGREAIPGSESELECDMMLIAAGFTGCRNYIPNAFGAQVGRRGTVNTGENDYATNVQGLFAAGDMRRGQSLVVWAIEEGRAVARQVDEYLMGYTEL